MNQTVTIQGRSYMLTEDVRDNAGPRAALNALTRQTFGFDFEFWYEGGYWENYYPCLLMDGEQAVANVSANTLTFRVEGKLKNCVQLGTVMTAPAYRGKGLSRFLMERVVGRWQNQCDCLYLFANNSVLDFYPKFGLVTGRQMQCEIKLPQKDAPCGMRKLNMDLQADRALLLQCYGRSNPYSALTLEHCPGLVMFYCTSHLKDAIYYLEQYDAVVVAEQEGADLHCYDIFGGGGAALETLLTAFKGAEKAMLGFSLIGTHDCHMHARGGHDDTLFYLSGKEDLTSGAGLLFPKLSHT